MSSWLILSRYNNSLTIILDIVLFISPVRNIILSFSNLEYKSYAYSLLFDFSIIVGIIALSSPLYLYVNIKIIDILSKFVVYFKIIW